MKSFNALMSHRVKKTWKRRKLVSVFRNQLGRQSHKIQNPKKHDIWDELWQHFINLSIIVICAYLFRTELNFVTYSNINVNCVSSSHILIPWIENFLNIYWLCVLSQTNGYLTYLNTDMKFVQSKVHAMGHAHCPGCV